MQGLSTTLLIGCNHRREHCLSATLLIGCNHRCKAFNKMVICNFGFMHFDLILDQGSGMCRCPCCHVIITPTMCAFNNCEWQFTGIKMEAGKPVQAGSGQWREAGNHYNRFSMAASDMVGVQQKMMCGLKSLICGFDFKACQAAWQGHRLP